MKYVVEVYHWSTVWKCAGTGGHLLWGYKPNLISTFIWVFQT